MRISPHAAVAWLASIASITLSFAQEIEPYGPRWVPTTGLNLAREHHLATLLADGRVLVFGGQAWEISGNTGWQAGDKKHAEIYDPGMETWTPTGSLNIARSGATATLLPTGHVLVAGGYANGETRIAELYDPAEGTWRMTGSLITARAFHTATLLSDGRVLVAGGQLGGDSRTGIPGGVHSAELYDPATEQWSSTGSTSTVSYRHTATLLPDGKVLALGSSGCIHAAELYDPATGLWSGTPTAPVFGCAGTAVLLHSGEVLVTEAAKAQLYDPATGEWRATSGPDGMGSRHTLTLLANGQVLAAGGQAGDESINSAALYDPAMGMWTATASLIKNRAAHSATLLPNGRVLVVGGFHGGCCDWRDTLSAAELFDPGKQ
jgi:N-acetylneuraminic acid mutarotase